MAEPDVEKGGASRNSGARLKRQAYLRALIFFGFCVWAVIVAAKGQVVLGSLAALVFMEFGLAILRGPYAIRPATDASRTKERIAPMLDRLCERAGCSVTRLIIGGDGVRAASVRRGRNGPMLSLAEPVVQRLTDEELGAIVAHELIHVTRDDLARARLRGLGALCVSVPLMVVCLVAEGLKDYPIAIATLLFGFVTASIPLSLFNRPLEYRADIEGTRLCGDPVAMDRALAVVQDYSEQTRSRRFGPQPWKTLLWPLSWHPPSHPPMADRITRVKSLSTDTRIEAPTPVDPASTTTHGSTMGELPDSGPGAS